MTGAIGWGVGAVLFGVAAMASAAGVEVVGDNSVAVRAHAKLKPAAEKYLHQLDDAVHGIAALTGRQVDGAAIAVMSRKMAALKNQGEQFGPALSGPLDECRSAGIFARAYWDVMAGFVTTSTPAGALDAYRERAGACREQVATPPKLLVTLKAVGGNPPFRGCLRVLSPDDKPGHPVLWTCPKGSVKL